MWFFLKLSVFVYFKQVLATTFDGASVNRRLVALHNTKDEMVYKLFNIYADEERYIP